MIAKKIEKLTPDQEVQLTQFYQKWFDVGSSCEPADRQRAEATVTAMYAVIGKKKPQFIWFASPATCCLGRAVLMQGGTGKIRKSLKGSSLWSSLESSLESSLWSSLGS